MSKEYDIVDSVETLKNAFERVKKAQVRANEYAEISGKSRETEDDFIKEIIRLQNLYQAELEASARKPE